MAAEPEKTCWRHYNPKTRWRYYDPDGDPITLSRWVRMRSKDAADHVPVASNMLGSHLVSTVWLGVDHTQGTHPHNPLIFETRVFYGPQGAEMKSLHKCYSNARIALSGHEYALKTLRVILEKVFFAKRGHD